MTDRDRIADVLARHYDGRALADLRDEHAAHHREAADAVITVLDQDAAFTELVRLGQDLRSEPYRPIGHHTYEGDGTEPCRTVLFGQPCEGTEAEHVLSEYRLTDEEKKDIP